MTEHPSNKGKKQEILVSVWDFGAVHPQSERDYYVCNYHAAKMHPPLAKQLKTKIKSLIIRIVQERYN